jgi:two-component system heavy metal sensor histidine kinase CusS
LRSRNTLYESDNWPEGFPHEDLPNFDELKDRIRMIKHDEAGGFVRYSLLEEPYLYTKAFDGGRWRMATITNPELTLYIGISLSSYFAEIRQLRFVYFGGLIAVILGIGFGGYWIARKALKPVDAIAIAAKCFTSKDLAKRIPVSSEYDLEFDSLVAVINEMMDRLETSFNQAMRFSADVSHELKTPLAIIQNEISSRLQNVSSNSAERDTFNRLLEEVQRLKSIIRSLSLLSQADAGSMPLTIETYDFSEQLDSFAHDNAILAEEVGLLIDTSIAPNIWVEGDRLMLGQVVQNLIGNAIKYNATGGFVKWALDSKDDMVVFAIENSGLAIVVHDQSRIFERFFRGRGENSASPAGLGLGLSLAREIVLAHGGSLSLIKSDEIST